ncbi:MAG: phage minor capsid protein [Lachnospiraceae bacterium]|nr:phage minor capsid protein [Lachnospiraceae bacterium]
MTPEELEKLPKPLERTMTNLELSIMAEIIDRIKNAAEITPVVDWLIIRLTAIGAGKRRIKKLISDALRESDIKVNELYERAAQSDHIRSKEIYEDAGQDYQPYEDNKWMQQVVEAVNQQTKDSLRTMENITKTTGFNVPMGDGKKVFTPLSEYLERSLDKAMMGIATGAKTYSQAIGDVVDEMTASGVRVVDYASGRTDRIEVAARRAVMTGVAQMTDKVNAHNAKELGTDYWEVDWHMGARNTGTGYMNHQSWQGKVYSSDEMKTVCGLGNMLGFAGINCYHIRFPFIQGISKRKYTDEWLAEQNRKENEKKEYHGKQFDTYGALQHQRKLERTIRKQKQDVKLLEAAGADKDDITAAKCRLRLTNKTYVDFSKQMGLRQQLERMKIPNPVAAANAAIRNTGTKVNYNPRNDYSVNLDGYPENVNSGLSKAVNDVAEKGGSDGFEHMHLVNLKTGEVEYYETNRMPNEVGYKFWKHLDEHQENQYAFVHNHNTDSSFSEPDIRTLLSTKEIPIMIAVRNDGVKYIAERSGEARKFGLFDELYPDEINALNQQVRDGIISTAERGKQREIMIVNNLLRDYTKERGLVEYDGRK